MYRFKYDKKQYTDRFKIQNIDLDRYTYTYNRQDNLPLSYQIINKTKT